ncbi:MAG: orotidine-5'-phosphate decarboxylase [Gemmatimonadota bacterium]|nr:orotidine-5'-phosphate decarboxylase [Gemmatimonadota bacterium]
MTGHPAIPSGERLILALDVPGSAEARALVERLGDDVRFYKLGLELCMSGEYFELIDWLQEGGKKVFADLKLFDVPNTVARAVARLEGRGIDFVTVHGNDAMLRAACAARPPGLKILAVTALTSLDQEDMRDLGFETDIPALVLSRARRALELGCDGVISSGLEAASLRRELGPRLLVIVPGIRPGVNRADDQKRTVDVEEAFERGADYIVVGRPIRDAPDPKRAAAAMQGRIRAWFATRGSDRPPNRPGA